MRVYIGLHIMYACSLCIYEFSLCMHAELAYSLIAWIDDVLNLTGLVGICLMMGHATEDTEQ